MPATTKKNVDPSHTIEYQRTVINDIAGDLHSIFTGTAAINAATIQIAGDDIGSISDHIDKTIFFYYGVFDVDTTIGSPSKFGEIYSHEDGSVDIEDTKTVTIDDNCVLVISDTTEYKFFSNETEQTNPQKLTGFADNIRTSVVKDQSLTGKIKVGYVPVPTYTEALSFNYWTPSAVTYDKLTGDMVLTIGSHSLTVGTNIKIEESALVFKCSKDNNVSLHSYPRSTDPYYNKNIPITAVTSTTITVNVGIASTLKNYDVKDATYVPTTGLLEATIGTHSLTTDDWVELVDSSITFVCADDNYQKHRDYPRSTDPASGTPVKITAVTGTTITVNVGSTTGGNYTHKFKKALPNAIKHGEHTFVSAAPKSISAGGIISDDVPVDIDDTFTVTVDDQAVLII